MFISLNLLLNKFKFALYACHENLIINLINAVMIFFSDVTRICRQDEKPLFIGSLWNNDRRYMFLLSFFHID